MDMGAFTAGRYDQKGSVILIVMMVLALVTIIGVSATNMSVVEQKIAGNDKNYKIVFYHAESGNYGMAKWVSRVLDDDEVSLQPTTLHRFELAMGQTGAALKDEAYDYDGAYDSTDDLTYTMKSGRKNPDDGTLQTVTSNVGINLDRLKAQQVKGGGAEFGTGASGVGERAAIEIPYWFTTQAAGSGGARASITSKYIKLLGIPGGL